MVILRWIFVLVVVAMILAGLPLIDAADRLRRRPAGKGEPVTVDQARSATPPLTFDVRRTQKRHQDGLRTAQVGTCKQWSARFEGGEEWGLSSQPSTSLSG